ncbi:hypothetical protein [Burkholderia pseudomallei]|uniref:hypothetical protein n=1 Tax=Burkholderia pseudomallei TaxID=28450 RepID=UPI001177D241|nr:hypothetical protein [Burkholderia pseudomallei]
MKRDHKTAEAARLAPEQLLLFRPDEWPMQPLCAEHRNFGQLLEPEPHRPHDLMSPDDDMGFSL